MKKILFSSGLIITGLNLEALEPDGSFVGV